MNNGREKILRNVFIPAGGNSLRLCSLLFDEKFKRVIPQSEYIFNWNEIEDAGDREKIKAEVTGLATHEAETIEGDFMLAVPGGIDPHVHFNTPGFEFRDTFEEASLAAAYGGVTTVIDMPCTSMPPVTNAANMNAKLKALENRSHVDYALWGGIAGNEFNVSHLRENIKELADAGAAGFKAYLILGMDTFRELNEEQMKAAADAVSVTGKPLAVHAEDKEVINLTAGKFSGDDFKNWETYCAIRSVEAEKTAVKKMAGIVRTAGCKIHIVHLSSSAALAEVIHARSEGVHFTAETCPHYLYFTKKDFENKAIRNYLKTAPPVKSDKDKEALWNGIASGAISFITTDHAGCDPEKEKSSDDFSAVYGGIPGVGHRVPFLFSEGFLKGRINLAETVNQLSSNAAIYFGIKGKGFIKEGYDADLALINLWTSETVSASSMHSKGKYSPFEGVIFNAAVEKTFLRGRRIAQRYSPPDDSINKLSGRFIKV